MSGRSSPLPVGSGPFGGWSPNPIADVVHPTPTPALAAERELALPGMPLAEQHRSVCALAGVLASEART